MPATSKVNQRAQKEKVTPEELILSLLNKHDTINEAANELGVSYVTFWQYMNDYQIERVVNYRVKGEELQCAS